MNKVGKEFLDDLTGLYNRRYLLKKIPKQLEETQRNETPLSIVMIDLDHFKNVNDTYGHACGDEVLREFAIFLKTLLRQNDTVFRYGGDEFICILPNTDYEQARRISWRFIEQCRVRDFSKIRLTLSIGIASSPMGGKDWSELFDIADRNLYTAKRHGRDRIGVFDEEKRGLTIPTEEIVGRDEETNKVKGFIDPIFTGGGGAVCISGEIGVGKTRLVREIVSDPDFQDVQFLHSNLSATTKSIPYYPFREIIRTVINKQGTESIKAIPRAYQIELVKIVPELSDKAKETDEHIYMVDKFRLFESVRKFLALLASKQPLYVVLDNINWADQSSLDLLYYLVRTLRKNPIFFFLVYRIEEADDSIFQNMLHLMVREKLYEEIILEPLRTSDVARMLSLIIDAAPPFELTDYIFNESGGNPFFIEELMKSLEINDALVWDKGRCVFNKNKRVAIPNSIEGVVERKLTILGGEACGLLRYAAVIGRDFDFAFLKDVTGMNEGHLFDLMDDILRMRLLKESGGEQYCFAEEIIREVIYNRIGGIKLKHYHQAVGERLLSFYKDRIKEISEELAHHFYLGKDRKRAIEYSMIAADQAKDAYANRDAIRFYTWAIECLKDKAIADKELKEIECLRNRAGVLNLIGENVKAVADLERAISKAKEVGKKKEEADCLTNLCKFYLDIACYRKILKRADIALRIYQELDDKKGEANSLNDFGIAYDNLSEYQKALKFYKRSLKIREEIGDPKGKSSSYNNIGVLHHNLGEYSKALDFYKRSLKIDEENGYRIGEGMTLNNIGVAYSDLGENSRALEFHQHALEIREEIGDRKGEAVTLINIGLIYDNLGEYSRALEYHQRSLEIAREIGDPKTEATILDNVGNIHEHLGEYNKALKSYHRSLRIKEEIGDRKGEAEILKNISDTLVETKDFSTAEEYCRKAYAIAQQIESKSLLANVFLGITSLYLVNDNLTDAEKLLNRILSLADELNSKRIKAEALSFLGRLHTKEKKWDRAKSSFGESISILKQIKARFELARVYYYQGLMFQGSGDRVNAKECLTMAMRTFKKLGAKGWIKKIEGLAY